MNPTHADTMDAALAAKDKGTSAFRANEFGSAFVCYSSGISRLCPEANEVVDYGLLSGVLPESALALPIESQQLLCILCNNRAASAMKLSRPVLALADTCIAHGLLPSAKTAFRRAQALLEVGACSAAQSILRPYESEADLKSLSQRAEARATHVTEQLARLAAAPNSDTPLAKDLRFIGPMELRRLDNMRGRGWFATEDITAGNLLLVEPAPFPLGCLESPENPLPLCSAIARRLAASSNAREDDGIEDGLRATMRELLMCMHPVPGVAEDTLTKRDVDCKPIVASLAHSTGMPLDEALALERRVQRNQMSLTMRVRGESVEFGSGLFPFASLLNHSCFASAVFQPLSSGHVMVARALRNIQAGDEVTDSYVCLSLPRAQRRAQLERAHGFSCHCERCFAPVGSELHRIEQQEWSLVCPTAGIEFEGDDKMGRLHFESHHMLVPDDPCAPSPRFTCRVPGCNGCMGAMEAGRRVQAVRASFEALNAYLTNGAYVTGCEAATAAEREAERVLSPQHHEWSRWVALAIGLAGAAMETPEVTRDSEGSGAGPGLEGQVTALLLRAYGRREAMLLLPSCAGDDDCFVRVNHALVAGLDTVEGERALRGAFAIDAMTHGSSVEGFFYRWIPEDMYDGFAPEARRVLAGAARTPDEV